MAAPRLRRPQPLPALSSACRRCADLWSPPTGRLRSSARHVPSHPKKHGVPATASPGPAAVSCGCAGNLQVSGMITPAGSPAPLYRAVSLAPQPGQASKALVGPARDETDAGTSPPGHRVAAASRAQPSCDRSGWERLLLADRRDAPPCPDRPVATHGCVRRPDFWSEGWETAAPKKGR